MRALAIIVGGAAIGIGIIKNEFFSSDESGGSISDQPIAPWIGKTLFVAVGIFFMLVGLFSRPN